VPTVVKLLLGINRPFAQSLTIALSDAVPTGAMRAPVWRPTGFFSTQLAQYGRMQASSETKQGLPNVSAAMRWATIFRRALFFDFSTLFCDAYSCTMLC
jgi:hypothetical protein